jgi:hypothetical protein
MNRQTIIIITLLICILLSISLYAKSNDNSGNPTITITKLNVTDKSLELSWEIRNDSGQDAWILAGLGKAGNDIAAFMDEDDQTLMMRRRLDVPARPERASFPRCFGRYVRLCAGQVLTESVSTAIPVHRQFGLGIGGRKESGLEYAKRLTIEIGYYTGDLPKMIRRLIEKDEGNPLTKPFGTQYYTNTISGWFDGLLGFNRMNELVKSREDEVLILFNNQAFTGEQVLRVVVNDLSIPYEEEMDLSEHRPPDLSPCTRVEIQYQPSMLEYFFPYTSQQSLLSPTEKEYLQSFRNIVVQNPNNLKVLTDEVNKTTRISGIVRQRSVAHIDCYRYDERLFSFPIYNDVSIVTKGRYQFQCPDGFQSLRMLTPQIQPIDLRIKCAANIKNLWYRFRLYYKAKRPGFLSERKKVYPTPNTWCDSMFRAYRRATDMSEESILRYHVCPSAGFGKCHYAMNPNCKMDSPADMVLLFEIEGGWNQYGGPELLTFNNHNPRGGCVLLNDGSVKFISTTKELQQLRWK